MNEWRGPLEPVKDKRLARAEFLAERSEARRAARELSAQDAEKANG